ncbi:MAG TPA: L,D-transpeptidase family protein [Gammaproteobacteria bacterium]|nr:L,D-transpeptidase family protein [Gammaproteobacteria bacterium]
MNTAITAVVTMLAVTLLAAPPTGLAAEGPPLTEQLQLRIGALAEDPRVAGQTVADRWFLTRFYERRQFNPAWGSAAKREQLLAAVAGSVRHGLNPEDYHRTALSGLVGALPGESPAALLTELDILATDALTRLAFHLQFGKVNPEQLESSWNFSRDVGSVSPVTAIRSLLRVDDLVAALDALAPDNDYYRGLLDALAAYRQIAAAGGWPPIEGGETLRVEMRSARVVPLRALLRITGDLPADEPDGDGEYFEPALEAAVMRFQVRHGLEGDGAVGRRTLAALNVPVEARIEQLRVNLERVRWVFRDLDERFLVVNIARFRVVLVQGLRVVWGTRAVVGRPYRQTPVFKARMTYLEFNPTWTVPPTILAKDLLPELRQDPTALQRKNMSVLDFQGRRVDPATVDWATIPARGFPYVIRQEPGPLNALGRVKFMYPNPHHVYMHDTPAREHFAHSERTFSSGCIRLEQPLELARILLAGTEWDDEAIERLLASGRTRVVNLSQPIMVLMLYGTAVPEGGRMHFAADVYRRDARLLAALDAPFEFSPPAGYEEALRLDESELE